MSQYPSPPPSYPPPPGYYNPYQQPVADAGAPARRASILMMVVGVLMLLFGGCMGAMAKILPTAEFSAEQRAQFEQLRAQLPPGLTLEMVLMIAAGVMVVFAITYLVLGFLVRGGGKGWIITSIVVTTLVLLYMALNTVGSVIGPAANPAGLCVALPMLAVFVLMMVWLVQAVRAVPTVSPAEAAMRQYQAQMWHYQQSQQAYPPQGQYPTPPNFGGGYAPPPPQQPQGYGYGQQSPPPQQQSPQSSPQPQWKDPNAPPEG